jgi:hypothetical protein
MPRLLLLNNLILFLCCSMYLGTGGSLVLFQFPLEPKLTVDNYYMVFVEPVANATAFFTYMTTLMLITAVIMLATEWFSGVRWTPIVVLCGVVIATAVTIIFIFPLNQELSARITDPERLRIVFHEWANWNRVRVALWIVQWSAMMFYFYKLARKARGDR